MPKTLNQELTKVRIEATPRDKCIWDGGTAGVKGLGLRVTKGGARTFIFRYRTDGGQQRFLKIGSYPNLTVSEARELAKKRTAKVADGADPSRDRKLFRDAPTMADLAAYYLEDYAVSSDLRASTVKDAKALLAVMVAKMGRQKVSDVTAPDIRRLHGDTRREGQGRTKDRVEAMRKAVADAAATLNLSRRELDRRTAEGEPVKMAAEKVKGAAGRLERAEALLQNALARLDKQTGNYQANRTLAILSKLFSLAIENGWRTDNPCRGIAKFTEDQRQRNLSDDEVGRLLAACDAYEGEHGGSEAAAGAANIIRLLLFTGARLREVVAAEWGQFELERGVWLKPSAHTKTRRQHRFDLDGPALDLLRQMRERAPYGRYLFPGKPATGPHGKPAVVKPRADIKKPWRWITREAGIQDVRVHDLRRTNASFILSDGHALPVVGKALGHTQVATTARYAFLENSVQRKATKEASERMVALKGRSKGQVVNLHDVNR